MRLTFPLTLLLITLLSTCALAQKEIMEKAPLSRELNMDMAQTTTNTVKINGKAVPYEVTIGVQPVYNAKSEVTAGLHYTYYVRTDVTDPNRPLLISFNGGPGSGSVWMHLAYTGPKVLNID
ncbi:MAG: carboxypeptidase C (cathepsin A), partial [Neolewinella sp.]